MGNLFSDKTSLVLLCIIVVLIVFVFNLLWSKIGDKSKVFKNENFNNKNYMYSQDFANTNKPEAVKSDNNDQNTKITATDFNEFSEKNISNEVNKSVEPKENIIITSTEQPLDKAENIDNVDDKNINSIDISAQAENDHEKGNQASTEENSEKNNIVNEALAEVAIAEDRILDQGLEPSNEVHLSTNSIGTNSKINREVNKFIVQTSQEQQLAEELINKAEQEQKDKSYKQSLKKDNKAMALVRILPKGEFFIAENIFDESKKCGFYFNELDKCFEYPIQQGQYKNPIFKLIQDVAPGRFELEDLGKQIKGIVIFTRFCYSGDSVNNVRIMLSRAKLLASRLDADLCDNDFNFITTEYEQTILAIAKKYRCNN